VAVSASVSTVSRPSAPPGSTPGAAARQAGAKDETVNPHEADLPRWLRPSLRQQRQTGDRANLSSARRSARFDS
jgi:hypothetical protein